MRKFQIGIMGSAADLNYSQDAEGFAKELGQEIAKRGYILIYGAEKDYSSLSTISAMASAKKGGMTVGITSDKDKTIFGDFYPTVIIPSGLGLGGGREFPLVLTCDVIITIGGGSGTLTEIAIAYQANIPIVVVDKFDGWSKKLAGKYLDGRNRLKCERATTPKEALDKAVSLIKTI